MLNHLTMQSGRPALAYLPPPVDSTQLGPKVNSRGMHVMQPGDVSRPFPAPKEAQADAGFAC